MPEKPNPVQTAENESPGGGSKGAELAKELEVNIEHARQLSELKSGMLKNIFIEEVEKARAGGALDRSLPFFRQEFEKMTSLISPQDHHMDHSLKDELSAIKFILGYKMAPESETTTSTPPAEKKPDIISEALNNFTEKSKNDRPPATEKIKELWYKATHKSGENIKDAEKIFENEANKEGSDTLRQARAQLSALRAFERRTAIRKLEPGELEEAEQLYKKAFKEHLLTELEQLKQVAKAEKKIINQDALRTIATQHLLDEMSRRSELEAAIQERRGGTGLGKVNWFRNHPKIRIAVGVGLAGGAIAAGALGAGLPAAAFGAARLGVRAFGGYDAAQNIQERLGTRREHSAKKEHEQTRNLTGDDVDNLSPDEQIQRTANLLAAKAQVGAGEKYANQDQEVLDKLIKERNDEYGSILKEVEKQYTGANFAKGIEGAVAIFLAEQLKAEKARLNSDKVVGSKRFKRAAVIGAAIAVLPFGQIAEHALGNGNGNGNGNGGGSNSPSEKPGKAPADTLTRTQPEASAGGAEYAPDKDSSERPRLRFADREWKVKPGESQWRIAHEIMNYHPNSFGDLNPQQKMVAVDRLKDLMGGKDLIYPGEIQVVKGEWVKDALETGRNYK